MLHLRINRNIVECKYEVADNMYRRSELGINKNIVECKCRKHRAQKNGVRVLIETLWNVNFQDAWKKEGKNTVLIETLWNVN